MATTYQQNIAADSTTITASGLASLASSSTRLAGFALASVDQRTNLDITDLLSLLVTVGTTPTINTQIDVWIIPARSTVTGTLAWPDVFDGTAAAKTATSAGCLAACGILVKSFLVDATTSNRPYELVELDIAAFNNGTLPFSWQVFVAHNTGVNFNATGGNFTATHTRIRYTGA